MGQLDLKAVTKSFGQTDVIKGVDLTVADGEFCVFVGPSGCGKSTLLRIIAGLEDATSGDILIDGKRVNAAAPADREIAMVFQSYALYPHLTVKDNMALGLKQAGTARATIDERVANASRMLSLEPLLARRPSELSGGQRQRVAIGRAIVRTPKLFLFDEPLSNLDAALRVHTRIEIARLHRALAATMVYVTHDQVEAMTMGDRVAVLDRGVLQQCASPKDLFTDPVNLFVAGFIGSPQMNLLAAELGDDGAVHGGLTVAVTPAQRAAATSADVTIGVRPEDWR
ncbi:MAG: ABC transporter ATP-binding protein, partial [Candidatus Limnocylindrales bacterium]